MSPVPRNTMRMGDGEQSLRNRLRNDQSRRLARLPCSLLNLTLTERFRATRAQIVVNLSSGQDKQQTLTHGHGASALFAVERGSAETFELAHLGCDQIAFLRGALGFPFVCNVGNNRIEDDDRRVHGIDIHDKIFTIMVEQGLLIPDGKCPISGGSPPRSRHQAGCP